VSIRNIAFLVFLLLVLGTADAWACRCFGPGTAQGRLEKASMVVRANFLRIEKLPLSPEQDRNPWAIRKKAIMRVEGSFKGGLKIGEEIAIGQTHGSDCRFSIEPQFVGESVLMYLDGPEEGFPGLTQPTHCNGSDLVRNAVVDIRYIERAETLRGRTMISGVVRDWSRPGGAAEVAVLIKGRGKLIRLRTDAEGYYEALDLRPGSYRVHILPPDGRTIKFATVAHGKTPSFRGGVQPDPTGVQVILQSAHVAQVDFQLGESVALGRVTVRRDLHDSRSHTEAGSALSMNDEE
jgi:hypothetical protein